MFQLLQHLLWVVIACRCMAVYVVHQCDYQYVVNVDVFYRDRHKPLWPYEEITTRATSIKSTAHLEALLSRVLTVFSCLPGSDVRRRWAKVALQVNCCGCTIYNEFELSILVTVSAWLVGNVMLFSPLCWTVFPGKATIFYCLLIKLHNYLNIKYLTALFYALDLSRSSTAVVLVDAS